MNWLFFEELQADSVEKLDKLVNDFIEDKIIYNVECHQIGRNWTANVFYDDIPEGSEIL